MGQHGFRLIVGGVRHGHARHAALGHGVTEKLIAQPPRRVLEIPLPTQRGAAHVLCTHDAFQTMSRRQLFHESLIVSGIRTTKLVIEMEHHEPNPERIAQFQQQPQQRN